MFETDYPHGDSTWPHSRAVAEKLVAEAGLDEREIYLLIARQRHRVLRAPPLRHHRLRGSHARSAHPGGDVIDGTGSAAAARRRRHARRPRRLHRRQTDEPARRTIDADGRVVAPGFVDVHTHLDAQAFWDPDLSPSPLHGVTTVISGNCGFTIAPADRGCRPLPHADAGEGRGHAAAVAARRRAVELAHDGRVPRRPRRPPRHQRRVHGRALGDPARRDGRGRQRAGGDRRRAAADDSSCSATAWMPAGSASRRPRRTPTTTATATRCRRASPTRGSSSSSPRCAASSRGRRWSCSRRARPGSGRSTTTWPRLMITMSAIARRPLNWNVIQPAASNLDSCLAKLEVGDRAAARGAQGDRSDDAGRHEGPLLVPRRLRARRVRRLGGDHERVDRREAAGPRRPAAASAHGRAGGRHHEHAPPGQVAGPRHRRDVHARDGGLRRPPGGRHRRRARQGAVRRARRHRHRRRAADHVHREAPRPPPPPTGRRVCGSGTTRGR